MKLNVKPTDRFNTNSERTRVLLWCWGRKGGGPRYTLEVARALARIPSFDLHMSLSRQSEIFTETQALGLPGFDVDTYSGLVSCIGRTLSLPSIVHRFIEYLEKQHIDIVICTMRHPWSGWAAKHIRSKKRRYIYTVHDAAPHDGDDHLGWEWILKSNLQYADGVLVLSEYVRRELLRQYGYPDRRIWVSSHGPFKLHEQATESTAPERTNRLLFFGRILPYKGLALLAEAFSRIADHHDLQLAVVGHGSLGCEKVRLLAHPRICLDNRWIPEEELASVFKSADLVVAPYLEASQSGVIAAAYGMGLPVVVTPVGGLREQVIDRKSGLIAAEITPQAFADAMADICSNQRLYRRCREGAKQLGDNKRIWSRIADSLASILGEVKSRPAFNGSVVSRRRKSGLNSGLSNTCRLQSEE
jgi:glycosyltransferase involved in cell wall biosynthesis